MGSLYLVLALALALIVGLIFIRQAEINHCESRGGHWVHVDRSGVCLAPGSHLLGE